MKFAALCNKFSMAWVIQDFVEFALQPVMLIQVQDLSYLLDTMEEDLFSKRFKGLSKALCEVTSFLSMPLLSSIELWAVVPKEMC